MPNNGQHALLVVDLEARQQIAAATQAFQSHERVWLSYNQEAKDQRARMEDKLDNLAEKFTTKLDEVATSLDTKINKVHGFMFSILWTGACSLIVLLVAIVAFFVGPFFMHH